MPMTNAVAVARAWDMINTIGTLSDGLAQYDAAQARFYIASLYDVGFLDKPQFEELMAANVGQFRLPAPVFPIVDSGGVYVGPLDKPVHHSEPRHAPSREVVVMTDLPRPFLLTFVAPVVAVVCESAAAGSRDTLPGCFTRDVLEPKVKYVRPCF